MHEPGSTEPIAATRLDVLDDGLVFTIMREARLNAIDLEVLEALENAVDTATAQRARLLVVTAAGTKSFCAGTDLHEGRAMGGDAMIAKSARARELLWRLSRAPFVSIAAVNGLAFGGGLELAIACTLRIAAPGARFSMPEIKLGVLPAYGGTQFLPALVGRARALDMMLTGRVLELPEALSIGLVDRMADAAEPLVEQAIALARSITVHGPLAIDAIRACVAAAGAQVGAAGLAVEGEHVGRVMRSADAAEGIAAFLEKRPPVFRGR